MFGILRKVFKGRRTAQPAAAVLLTGLPGDPDAFATVLFFTGAMPPGQCRRTPPDLQPRVLTAAIAVYTTSQIMFHALRALAGNPPLFVTSGTLGFAVPTSSGIMLHIYPPKEQPWPDTESPSEE